MDRLNLTDNTLVVFSSDNGPARGKSNAPLSLSYDTATGAGFGIAASKGITAGRKGYKASLFEGGINVPFIVRWPGKVAAGKVDDRLMISAVDLLPTFCEVGKVQLPASYKPDGLSQLAGLLGDSPDGRSNPLFWKMKGRGKPQQANSFHWADYVIVDQQWKLLADDDSTHVELYNIVEDVYEKNDLHDAHPQVVAALSRKLADWKATLPSGPDPRCFSSLREK